MSMEESLRSGDRSGVAVKKRSSSGCLIVKRKGDGMCGDVSSGSIEGFSAKENERKRPRLLLSSSETSEEDLSSPLPPRGGVAAGSIRACNGYAIPGKHIAEDVGLTDWNGEAKRKMNRLDVFQCDQSDEDMILMPKRQHDGEGKRFLASPSLGRSDVGMKFESSSSRHAVAANRKGTYLERGEDLSCDRGRGIEGTPPSSTRKKRLNNSDKPNRVLGKDGGLKVHVNKKKPGVPSSDYDQWKRKDNRNGTHYDGIITNTAVVLHSADEKYNNSLEIEKNCLSKQTSVQTETSDSSEEDSWCFNMLMEGKSEDAVRRNLKREGASMTGIDREKVASKFCKSKDGDPDDLDVSLKPKFQEFEHFDSSMKGSFESEKKVRVVTPSKVIKRGSGTEKQKLRENIRKMLLSAGWVIDYKPRRNRDYLDAVYTSPSGTSYWSIIKAYEALQRQLDDEAAKNGGDRSAFLVSNEIISQLTRKTQKKMKKDLKNKQHNGTQSQNAIEPARKKTKCVMDETESTESDSSETKLSSFMKQRVKSIRSKTTDSGLAGPQKKSAKIFSSNISMQGSKSRKLGRCTLLIRKSDKGSNSENDDFVPYNGKKTLLSWLIDSGVVQLSQKVQYKNRKKTQVLLEGWITREGIHCGCCSKILTVSKFEIHAGSKLRQPFQNVYLDSGVSLLRCQIDAWNKQEESDRAGFHNVDVDGDDPNDDTCGLCGDGGDLICCDGCPSTFHQSCLDIQMLPQGDWYCPNCTCRYCGSAGKHVSQNRAVTVNELLTCNLCERKFHKSCLKDMDVPAVDSIVLDPSFCSQKCAELFEHLQKYLGIKHELETGFSWSIIRRTHPRSGSSLRGLAQRVESNSKVAVALSIMDECFLPIVDRRTGINLIHNVLYNCGSNFRRINYSGFYTLVLERGDEIISVASLRFHGTQLAEMPFIGTRPMYRRQGMCRRLFSAIESALRSLNVEMLVIPAISELMHTWTSVFGFTPAMESVRQEMRYLNMLVFPGLDMLQKLLLEQKTTVSKGTAATFSGIAATKINECKDIASIPLASDKCHVDLSTEQVQEKGDKVEYPDCDPKSQEGSFIDAFVVDSSLDDGRVHTSTELAVKSAKSELKQTVDTPSVSNGSLQEVSDGNLSP
ncbi:hypothetical protein SAY87_027572 [Trapa incisa]|uniref:PHD-type domain-containing protein n=1 Tax=Trapa incisa TaxID=236973 RepID=A0AAN7PKA0_9MYRT|nr:hypothetical protein SAY87_027572 [Trapa incisa]